MERRFVAREVLLWESLLRASIPSGLIVAAGVIGEDGLSRPYLLAAGVVLVVGVAVSAPSTLVLADGVLCRRRLGRVRSLRLEDVVQVRTESPRWVGEVLFLERGDGTGMTIDSGGGGSEAIRHAVGAELTRLGKVGGVQPKARSALGLERGATST